MNSIQVSRGLFSSCFQERFFVLKNIEMGLFCSCFLKLFLRISRTHRFDYEKERGVLGKLDIEEAYDQINWNFVVKVLERMGFGEGWIGLIKWCIFIVCF